jgi:hypothetical protein
MEVETASSVPPPKGRFRSQQRAIANEQRWQTSEDAPKKDSTYPKADTHALRFVKFVVEAY